MQLQYYFGFAFYVLAFDEVNALLENDLLYFFRVAIVNNNNNNNNDIIAVIIHFTYSKLLLRELTKEAAAFIFPFVKLC